MLLSLLSRLKKTSDDEHTFVDADMLHYNQQ